MKGRKKNHRPSWLTRCDVLHVFDDADNLIVVGAFGSADAHTGPDWISMFEEALSKRLIDDAGARAFGDFRLVEEPTPHQPRPDRLEVPWTHPIPGREGRC